MKQSPTLLDIASKESKPKFIQNWDNKQFKQMELAILRHFALLGEIKTSSGHGSISMVYDYTGIENFLGLAYTSGSSCAGLWVCNVDAINPKYPDYRYVGFAMSEDLKPYAILWDKDENEINIPL